VPRSRKVKLGLSWAIFGTFKWGQELSNRYRRLTQKINTEGTILLDINLDGLHLYLSDRYITVETYVHEGIVADWGSSDLAAGSSISELSDISIKIFNKRLAHMTTDERISDMLDTYSFEGRTATFRQYFTGLNYDECAIFHTGKINSVDYDSLYFYIDIVDDEDVFKEIPIGRVSKQEYSEVPSETVGLAKPIIFGVSPTRAQDKTKDWTVFPTVFTNKRTKQYIIADHLIGQDTFPKVTSPYGRLFMYIEEMKTYLHISTWSNSSYSNTSAGAILTLNDDVLWILHLRPNEKGTQYDLASDDFSNAIDEESTTLVLAASKKFYLIFGRISDFGAISSGQTGIRVAISSVTGSEPYGTMKYYNADYDNSAGAFSTGIAIDAAAVAAGYADYLFIADNSAHGIRDDQADQNDAWKWGEISKYEFGITVNAGCSITISDIRLSAGDLSFDANRTVRNTRAFRKR